MSSFPETEMRKLESLLDLPEKSLHVTLAPEFGAQNKMHRLLLKAELHMQLEAAKKNVVTGTDPIRTQGVPISVSHTEELGGFVWLDFPENNFELQMGLDIEVSSRVVDSIAKRICKTEAEFKSAPSASSLWVAKEAGFKCLRGAKQPQVLADVEITEWITHDSQVETCCLKDPQKYLLNFAKGVVLKKNAFKICFFISQKKSS